MYSAAHMSEDKRQDGALESGAISHILIARASSRAVGASFFSSLQVKRIIISEFAANTMRDMKYQTRPRLPTATSDRSDFLLHAMYVRQRREVEFGYGASMGAPR